ncbi:Uncharacterised protein [Klebsiella variicola]|uniref:Uncharacterized protein n=1 Tax=Klebsiella variicola TaxID=244366 RepID=A0A7H4MM07_KLEVA|nr:Uncharacterised protein [Klebsiella variicola]
MRQRQTGGDPRQRPAGKQLHRFTGQGRHLRHRVAGQQTAAAGHHVSLCGRDHIQGLAQLRARQPPRAGDMASDKVGAGGKIEHHRTGFVQLLRQLRRAYLLRLRAGRHLGGRHPAFAQLAADSALSRAVSQPICASHEPVIAARMPSSSSSTIRAPRTLAK